MKSTEDRIQVDVHFSESKTGNALDLLREGLEDVPPWISSGFLYDDAGSQLFEDITEVPEYYQTRTEFSLLQAVGSRIIKSTGVRDLVELGSGAAVKTRALLDVMDQAGQLDRYVPFDVNEWIVRRSAEELCRDYPDLRVHGVVGRFMHHLDLIPEGKHRLFIFLGGTLGNFHRAEAVDFLTEVRDALGPEDALLVGHDLIKDRAVLEAAYNDAQGVTAAFNKNVLNSVNALAGSTFNPEDFKHVAFFNEEEHRIEMWLEALHPVEEDIPELDLSFSLAKGQRIRTEISTKFNRELVEGLYRDAGLSMRHWFTDDKEYFALSVAQRDA